MAVPEFRKSDKIRIPKLRGDDKMGLPTIIARLNGTGQHGTGLAPSVSALVLVQAIKHKMGSSESLFAVETL